MTELKSKKVYCSEDLKTILFRQAMRRLGNILAELKYGWRGFKATQYWPTDEEIEQFIQCDKFGAPYCILEVPIPSEEDKERVRQLAAVSQHLIDRLFEEPMKREGLYEEPTIGGQNTEFNYKFDPYEEDPTQPSEVKVLNIQRTEPLESKWQQEMDRIGYEEYRKYAKNNDKRRRQIEGVTYWRQEVADDKED